MGVDFEVPQMAGGNRQELDFDMGEWDEPVKPGIGLSRAQVQSLFVRGLIGFKRKEAPKRRRFASREERREAYLERRKRFFAQGLTANGKPRKQDYPLTYEGRRNEEHPELAGLAGSAYRAALMRKYRERNKAAGLTGAGQRRVRMARSNEKL